MYGTLYCTTPGTLLAADPSGHHLLYRSEQKQAYRAVAPGKGSQREMECYSLTNGLMLYAMNAAKPVQDWGFDETTGDGILLYQDGSALAADIFTSSEELRDYAQAVELP